MEVKLVGYTQPTEEFKAQGIENVQDMIAFCAKVSNPSKQFDMQTSERLINYLIKHQHWSPLETCSATLEITTTRDIARQILRHRSAAFQEFSQRYADPTSDLAFELREARLQHPTNRQDSIEIEDQAMQDEWNEYQQKVIDASLEAYNWAIEKGIAKEQARAVLPEGNTVSRMYMQASIRTWVHYIELRAGNGTQKEHMEIARACAAAISRIFPMVENILEE
jgi:thymidylate synthase (FAD)